MFHLLLICALAAAQRIEDKYAGVAAYQLAELYAQWGDVDQAFEWLEKAFEVRDPGLTLVKIDAWVAPLRVDSRFEKLLKKMKLDDKTLRQQELLE